MKTNTLAYVLEGLESEKAKEVLTKVYASIEDSGLDLELTSQAKNFGQPYQSTGMDIRASVHDVQLLKAITLVERVSAMAFINQKMTLLAHLSANLCTVREYKNQVKALNDRFELVVWKEPTTKKRITQ